MGLWEGFCQGNGTALEWSECGRDWKCLCLGQSNLSAEIRAPGRTHLCYDWRNMSAFFSTGFVWCLSSLGVFGDHLGSCPHWEDSDCPCVLLSALAHPTHLIIAKGLAVAVSTQGNVLLGVKEE